MEVLHRRPLYGAGIWVLAAMVCLLSVFVPLPGQADFMMSAGSPAILLTATSRRPESTMSSNSIQKNYLLKRDGTTTF